MEAFVYREENGRRVLHAEGVSLPAVAAEFGTPTYCYANAVLVARFRALAEAAPHAFIRYSIKANDTLAVIRTFARLGAGADIISGGELKRALRAGMAPDGLVFAGPAKSRDEMDLALASGVGQFNVESPAELDALDAAARAKGTRAPVALRVNPDVDAGTHDKIATGRRGDKFGIDDGEIPALYARAASLEGIEPVGLAVHIGSQLTSLAPFEAAFDRLVALVEDLRAAGHSVERLGLGGGLGVRYREETPPDVAAYGALVERETYTRQDVLVWREKRRDGSLGATRRRLLPQVSSNGKGPKVKWQIPDEKSDEPFYYADSLDELKRQIATAGGLLYIVEGEVDVWSVHTLDILSVIGTYSATAIPDDIASILDELGVSRIFYFADNDSSGDAGAAKLAALLLASRWRGEAEYRKITGPGIGHKGDANDLLCHHHPDLAAARAALDALPAFLPQTEPEPARHISIASGDNDPRWDSVKEAVRSALGVTAYNRKGFSKKHFRCPDPQHEDPGPSANWHRDGFCHCFGCGKDFNAKEMAEFLDIPWRALLGRQPQILPSDKIDLNAAPREPEAASAPPFCNEPPDSLLRLSNRYYSTMHSALYYTAMRLRRAALLPEAFSVQEFIDAARALGCELKERAIYGNFEEARHGDDHPFFAKSDPSRRAQSWNRKFRLRPAADIQGRLLRCIRFRVYEEEFQSDPDTIIGFKVFVEAPLGSESAKALERALEPLIERQKQRYERLARKCEETIARCEADLADLRTTPLPPDWKIRKKSDLPAGKAHAIFEADGVKRSRPQWAELLGISKGSVGKVLELAGIKRTPVIKTVTAKSKHELLNKARKEGARIMRVETDDGSQPFDAAMEIKGEVTSHFAADRAEHEIVSDVQPEIRPTPAKPPVRVRSRKSAASGPRTWKSRASGTKPVGTHNSVIGS